MSTPSLSARPALLFDLDGTLVDSVYQHVLGWREALEAEGMDRAVWRIHRRIGMSGGLFLKALDREAGQIRPLHEARELLERLLAHLDELGVGARRSAGDR